MATLQAQLSKLTTLIKQSPFQLFSPDELAAGTKLTQGEFQARADAFINDAESGIPGDDASIALTKALLAKMHRSRLSPAVANAYMAPLFAIDPSLRPKAKGARLPRPTGKKSK